MHVTPRVSKHINKGTIHNRDWSSRWSNMTASMVSILGLLGLVTVGIATPGPNNMTCFIHSGLHGSRRTVPLILGMAVGFVSLNMLVVVVVLRFDSEPGLKAVIHWVGVSFIILLGLFVSRLATAYDVDAELPRLGPMAGFLMQWVNGKEWGFCNTLRDSVHRSIRRRPRWRGRDNGYRDRLLPRWDICMDPLWKPTRRCVRIESLQGHGTARGGFYPGTLGYTFWHQGAMSIYMVSDQDVMMLISPR